MSSNKDVILFLLFLGLSTGCSTTSDWVTKEYEPAKKGVLRYSSDWSSTVQEKRHTDAKLKMTDYCSPNGYVIEKETKKSEVIGKTIEKDISDNLVVSNDEVEYTYLHFRCK